MNGDGEETILEELTKGGLPSNVRAELVADAAPTEPYEGPIGTGAAPAVCGQNYTAGGRVFPEKCSLPAGHKPRSSTSNHFAFGLGWWA